MNYTSKMFTIFLIAMGLVIVPAVSMNASSIANAQSGAGTQHQTSQPHPASNSPETANKTQQVGQQFTFHEKSKPANDPQKCAELASKVSGKAVPDYNLCDVVVYRQAPAIVRNDNFVLNNFSGIGHYIEFILAKTLNETSQFMNAGNNTVASAGNNTAAQGNNNNTNVKVAFGEFALIDSEVVPVRQVMNKYNWTETALHHHMLNETPKILFLHWTVTGDANQLIGQAKEMLTQTSTYQNLTGNTNTPSSAGP